ncbi:spore protease YyaC [Virgibacillus sp. MSJ-26]|uniref:spore protease YyaC n=1 Tax=Virgibacillus sp. MSJ-26 TaxID=2841522 RepID=UPI001C11DFEF|nr:spore protease YyaC [Virgibacillus sp. MSJ-26]MBU5467476.1 spore protease YyaC [Virgibacillus sp. MSJ-26]
MNLKQHFESKNKPLRVLHTEKNVDKIISDKLISWLPKFPKEYVVVCVGTDRSTGDALGPLTGSLFSETKPKHMTVYGTLHEPVHATNLNERLKVINDKHHNPFIIAVDACLGKSSSVGCIIANNGPLKPGAALNKSLPELGDVHITGVVNVSGFMEYSVLQNTRLSIVKDMAKTLAAVLTVIDNRLTYHRSIPAVITPPQYNQETI